MRPQAAIFDLDGTLVDTESQMIDTALVLLRARGHAVQREFLVSLVGTDGTEGHERLCVHIGQRIDKAEFDAEWSAAVRQALGTGIALMPGVADLLDRLDARSLPRAVATNSTTAGALRKLRAARIADRFPEANVIGYDAVPRAKPAPDVYLAAADRLGLAPSACVAFEDSDPGVAAALAAGMTVVQIPDMAPTRARAAHHTVTSILDGARACGLI